MAAAGEGHEGGQRQRRGLRESARAGMARQMSAFLARGAAEAQARDPETPSPHPAMRPLLQARLRRTASECFGTAYQRLDEAAGEAAAPGVSGGTAVAAKTSRAPTSTAAEGDELSVEGRGVLLTGVAPRTSKRELDGLFREKYGHLLFLHLYPLPEGAGPTVRTKAFLLFQNVDEARQACKVEEHVIDRVRVRAVALEADATLEILSTCHALDVLQRFPAKFKGLFAARVAALHKAWQADAELGGGFGLAVASGSYSGSSAAEDLGNNAISWVFAGHGLSNTVLLLTADAIYAFGSSQKCSYLSPLKDARTQLRIHLCEKRNLVQVLTGLLRHGGASSNQIGLCFAASAEFGKAFEGLPARRVDAEALVEATMAKKDAYALRILSKGCRKADSIMTRVSQVVRLSEDDVIYHQEIKDDLLETIEQVASSCYEPLIESGGVYSIRARDKSVRVRATHPDPRIVSKDVVLVSFGLRYMGYCVNLARTFFFQPSRKCVLEYQALLDLRGFLIKKLTAGMRARHVYKSAAAFLKRHRPDLLPHLARNVGHGIGQSFRESHLVLDSKNETELVAGHVINLVVAFGSLRNPTDGETTVGADGWPETYSLAVGDLVQVSASQPKLLTKSHVELTHSLSSAPVVEGLGATLPLELLELIFEFLDAIDLGRACQVSRLWMRVPWKTLHLCDVAKRINYEAPMFQESARATLNTQSKRHNRGGYMRFMSEMNGLGASKAIRKVALLALLNQERHKRIVELNLGGCPKIPGTDFQHLQVLPRLLRLAVGHRKKGIDNARGVMAITRLIGRPRCILQCLSMPAIGMGPESCKLFFKALGLNSTLLFVDVSENPFGDSGATALATALETMTTVKELRIGGPLTKFHSIYLSCSVTERGARKLRAAVEANQCLDHSVIQ